MQRDDVNINTEAGHVVEIANLVDAMWRAQKYDRATIAAGLMVVAEVLADGDPIARLVLLEQMMRFASKHEPEPPSTVHRNGSILPAPGGQTACADDLVASAGHQFLKR